MCGVQAVVTELGDRFVVDHVVEIFIIPDLDLLDFMGGTEAVKEVDERKFALDCRAVSNGGQVHDFLYAGLAEHRAAGLTGSVDVGVVAEDVQRVGTYSTCRDVADCRKTFTGDLVKVRDHQKKTLGSREGGGHRTCGDGAVNCSSSACLGLQLRDTNLLAEDILSAGCCPLIDMLRHDG